LTLSSAPPERSDTERFTVIVCDWLPPAFGAVGQYMMQRAQALAAEGQSVCIVGLGDAYSTEHQSLGAGQLTVRRVRAISARKGGSILARGVWSLRKIIKLLYFANKEIAKTPSRRTEILVTGSPPFLSYVFILVNLLLWRRTLAYRITDFYPETVFAAGYLARLRPTAGLFHLLRRAASRIEALGEDQRRRLLESGMAPSAVEVVRDGSPVQVGHEGPQVPRPFGDDKVLLLYSGNMGVAHETETFLRAYEQHVREGSDRIRIWINGTGARLGPFVAHCKERGLPVRVSPPVDLEDLPAVLRTADAHLVLLKREFWGYVLPSKVYACLGLKAPLLFIGPRESDVDLLGRRREALYQQVDPGDVAACLSALENIADEVMKSKSGGWLAGEPEQREPIGAPLRAGGHSRND